MNAEKSMVMVGSSGGKMIVNSGKWHCGVCVKGVHANSVQCTVGKRDISAFVKPLHSLIPSLMSINSYTYHFLNEFNCISSSKGMVPN